MTRDVYGAPLPRTSRAGRVLSRLETESGSPYSTSAAVVGWTTGQSTSTIAGGTRLSANNMNAVPAVTVAPSATPAIATSEIAANHNWINLDRVISLSMFFTKSMCGFCTIPKTQSTDPPSSRRLPVKCDGSLPLDERTSNVHRGLSPIAQRPPHWSRTGKHVRNGTIEFRRAC